MSKKVYVVFLWVFVCPYGMKNNYSVQMQGAVDKTLDDKKQFLLPTLERLWPSPDDFLKQKMLSFVPRKSHPYSPLLQKLFCGVDVSDLLWNVKSLVGNKDKCFYQFNIQPIGLFFRYGIFFGLDGGYSCVAASSGPFVNVSVGWEYFNIGFCRFFVGCAKVKKKYPLWWMITPLSKTIELLRINTSWVLNLHVEIFFKRLILDCGIKKIPFFGDADAVNVKKTYFGLRMYLELQYDNVDDKIIF
ncbi:MAG: hypothetical protein II393_02645 [Cytophagales bacterium]|nr:hypothetical protein [Cytophagales bacterium]